jgi:hypothetical protein
MAVVQISRIQLRRGKENTTGLPQLASGELAWAIDTQKLYIGNGAVGEGAPAVGNTRILTEIDNLLDYGTYIYKDGDADIQTGVDVNFPVVRTLQERLDDTVSTASYGIVSGSTNQTEKIQRVIDNLFLDKRYEGTKGRVTLEFAPGEYTFNSTIYLPSYVSIRGAGKQKTIFNFTGNTSAFEFVNDTSTKTVRSTINSTTYNNQPKFCSLTDFTVNLTNQVTAFKLNAIRDSVFENVEVNGIFSVDNQSETGIGIGLYALSSLVTCQRNKFINVRLNGFTYPVYSKQDIFNNYFDNNEIVNSRYGFNFGTGANLSSTGEQYGPRKNIIENCYFEYINREAILVSNGYGNRSRSNTFVDVGNDGGGNTNVLYSVIKFVANGNTSSQDNFDRANLFDDIVDLSSHNYSSNYVKEVSGKVHVFEKETRTVILAQSSTTYTNLIRIPYVGSSGFEINYILESSVFTQMRRGKLCLTVDTNTNTIQVVDDYEYTGTSGEDTNIIFNAIFNVPTGTIIIQHKNTNVGDTSTMTYTYSAIS